MATRLANHPILVAIAFALITLGPAHPAPAGPAGFNPAALLDVTQVDDQRDIPFVSPATMAARSADRRPDWDAAMTACQAAGYTERECWQWVTDGEF